LTRGGTEQKIRKYLIDNNFIDCVIQLPVDLFFGTSIDTCIIVLKKNKSDNNILFIDASNEFVRGANKNKLTEKNINNIIEIIKNRENIKDKAVLVSYEEIKKKNYKISVSNFLEKSTEKKEINIKELNNKIEKIVENENELRNKINEIIRKLEG